MWTVHIIIAVSALLPAGLLYVMNLNKTESFIGYNTPRAHTSQETRKFSVLYARKGLLWAGLGTIFCQPPLYFLVGGTSAILLASLIMTIGFIVVLIMTEAQLNTRFDDKGKPKEMEPKY